MIGKKMEKALNGQIQAEMYSSNLYLAMAAWFEAENLPGFAHWMKVQAKEELGHAMKLFEYVIGQRARASIGAIEAPPAKWDSPQAAFEAVLEHEQKVTGLIHKLVELAAEEKDIATGIMLQWFVTEQVEEERNADAIVQQLRMIKGAPHGLLMIDRALAARG